VTIRQRITFWYGGVLLASMLLMAGVLYYELVIERRAATAAGKPKDPIEEELGEVVLLYGLPTALVSLVGGWLLLGNALGPLRKLTHAAERIQADNLRQPFPVTGSGDELDRLAHVLNAKNLRLDESFQRVRDFTLHASHELNTPLTVMRNELETWLAEKGLSVQDHDHIANLLDEIERLTHIVDSLTFLSRADSGLLNLARAPVALDELVRDALDDASVLAHPHQVQARLDACEQAVVSGDRRRLRQLLLILTDNAVKYNQPRGTLALSLRAQDGQACLGVSNTGPGIPSDLLTRVFDRFFRGDASHNKDVDGCGLGLSIAQWIVKAHDGRIRIASEPGGLTTVTVVLPLAGNNPA
jgi:signal transduction histidine kinase